MLNVHDDLINVSFHSILFHLWAFLFDVLIKFFAIMARHMIWISAQQRQIQFAEKKNIPECETYIRQALAVSLGIDKFLFLAKFIHESCLKDLKIV